MVLSKMNNHEHRTKQTYESYTFQPLMSFWSWIKNLVTSLHLIRHLVIQIQAHALWAQNVLRRFPDQDRQTFEGCEGVELQMKLYLSGRPQRNTTATCTRC